MNIGSAFLELTPQLNQNSTRIAERESAKAGERAGKQYGQGFDKGTEKASAFGQTLAIMGAKATIATAGLAAVTPAALQLSAALAPAAGALIAYPGLLLGVKAASAVTKVAILGVGEAIDSGFTGTAKEAEAALKKLPPEARVFAKSVIGLKSELTGLQHSISNRFFDPINNGFEPLTQRYLPMANRELPAMAQAIGATANQFAIAATKGQLFNGVQDLFSNTTHAIAIGNENMRTMVDAMGAVLSVSSSALPKLAGGFNDAATGAAKFILEAQKSGQLAQWMENGFTAIGKIVEILKNLGTVIGVVFQAASRSSGDLLGAIVGLSEKLAAFFKSVEGSQALNNFFTVTGAISSALRQGLMVILPFIGQSLAILAPAVQPLVAAFLSLVAAVAPLLPVAARLAVVIANVLAGAMATLATTLTPMIAKLTGGGSAGEGMDKLLASAEKLGPAINNAAGNVDSLTPALNATATAIAFVVNHTDTFVKLLPFIAAGFIAWKVAQLAANIAMAVSVPLRIAEVIATRQQTAALTQLAIAQAANTGATIAQRVATLASATATGIANVATKVWTATTYALGVAFRFAMGPVGLIITAIAALIAIIVLAYKHNETFRKIVDAVWKAIKIAVAATVDWFVQTAWPAIKTAVEFMGNIFNWLWKNVLVPAWNGIKIAIDVAWIVIKAIFVAVEAYVKVLGAIFMWLWHNIINPVWQGIKLAITIAWTAIKIIFAAIEVAIRILAAVFMWYWHNVITPVWNAFKTIISAAWNWVKSTVIEPMMGFIRGPVTAMWNAYKEAVRIVWDAIKSAVSAAWNWLKNNVFEPLMAFIRGPVLSAWNTMRDGIRTAWEAVKSLLKAGWDWVKSNVFDPVVNFITKTIPTAFNNGVAAVKTAWERIQAIVRTPVVAVVKIINDGIIGPFNTVSRAVSGPQIDRINFATGGIMPGYTPGRDVHRFVGRAGTLDLSGGEAIMRPEFTRAMGPAFINAANSVARGRGTSGVRNFMKGFVKHGNHAQYADGGIIGNLAGAVGKAWNAFTNPVETFKSGVNGMLGGIGGGPILGDILRKTVLKLVDSVANWITSKFNSQGPGAMGGAGGPGNWSAMWQWVKSRFPEAQLYSGLRNSTTLSGNKSLHASGRAIDVSPIRAISRAIIAAFGKNITELISPWPEEHIWHGQPHNYSDALDRQHGVYGNNAHIHWAMRKGGLFRYDGGGWLNPGDIGINRGRRPEAVLNPQESLGLKNLGTGELINKLNELIQAVEQVAPGVGGYIRGSGKGMIIKARGV